MRKFSIRSIKPQNTMNKQFSNVNAEPDFCVDFGNLSNCFLSLKNHVSESCPSTASKNRLKIKSAQYFCIFEFQNLSLEGEKICLKEAVKVRWHHCHRFLDSLNYKECLKGCFILPLFTSEWDLQKRRWFLVCRKGASVRQQVVFTFICNSQTFCNYLIQPWNCMVAWCY